MTITRVLFYADPHPIRNNPLTFGEAARKMCSIAQQPGFEGIEWKVFSSKIIIDQLRTSYPANRLLLPTPDEEAAIGSYMREWSEEAVAERSELVRGTGDTTEFYRQILRRVKAEFDFTHIVLWSDNGAVRSFARECNVGVLHIELGPTRNPYPPTLYFDPFGTNGYSSISSLTIEEIASAAPSSVDSWLTNPAVDPSDGTARELAFAPIPEDYSYLLDKPYIVVALQLFDDLNTVLHSPFSSPKDFIEYILPRLVELGFHIVIKGHPAAADRPLNLVHESRALVFAENHGDCVTILDRHTPASAFVPICARAAAVASINSSVSFEAWLLGVPGLTFGSAAYDVGGNIRASAQQFLQLGEIDAPHAAQVFDFLFRHYLAPDDDAYLATVLGIIIRSFDFSLDRNGYSKFLKSTFDHTERSIFEVTTLITRRERMRNAVRSGVQGDRSIIHYVDKFECDGTFVDVVGWVGRSGKSHPHPVEIGILIGDNILGIHSLADRPDVIAVHPQMSLKNGFSLRFPLPQRASINDIRLIAATENGIFTELKTRRSISAGNFLASLKALELARRIRSVARAKTPRDV